MANFKEYDDHVGLRIEFDKLPEKFIGIPISLIKGTTVKGGKEYPVNKLTVTYNGSVFTQNLRQLHWSKFKENIENMGIPTLGDFLGNKYVFQKTEFHVADPSVDSKPRWLPVKVHKGKKVA